MDVRKLRTGKGGVRVEWITREGPEGKNEHAHGLTSADPAHPDLVEALRAFRPLVCRLLSLPELWPDFTVSGMTVSIQKGEARGLIVHGQKSLEASGRPFNVVTPLLVEAEDVEADDLLADFFEVLDRVAREAEAYVKGKRAQGELFDGAGAETDEGEEPTDLGEDEALRAEAHL